MPLGARRQRASIRTAWILASVLAFAIALNGNAQSSSSSSFALQSSLTSGTDTSSSTNFRLTGCLDVGLAGVSSSPSQSLIAGCGAVLASITSTDLSISKTASPGPYGTGVLITYTIVVSNIGPAPATGVVVTDIIPAGTTFTSATPTQGSCTGTSTVTCSLGTINSAGSATIALVITLPSTPGVVANTASVTTATLDTNSSNNSSTSTITVIPAAAIPALPPLGLLFLALTIAAFASMRLRS